MFTHFALWLYYSSFNIWSDLFKFQKGHWSYFLLQVYQINDTELYNIVPTQKIPVQKGYTVYFMMKIMIIHYFRLSCTGVQKATCSAVLFWDARRRKTYHALIPPRRGMWMLSNLPRTTWRHSSTNGAKFRVCSVCSKNISTRVIQLNSYHKLM